MMSDVESALGTMLSDKPMLTVYGERNDPFGFQPRFKSMFPHAHEYVVPGGNHFPMCDDAAGIAKAITRWWDDVMDV